MASKPSKREKENHSGRGGKPPDQDRATPPTGGTTVQARRRANEDAWELVHPRCARDRDDDLAEVRKMLEAGETEVARDECRWLLEGCSDCLEAHRLLGEIAIGENDLALARGHFGYAYRLGTQALQRAGAAGPLPYRVEANQGFLESGKALAWCLKQLGKRDMAAEVVAQLMACDPSDPLGVSQLLAD